MKFDRDALLSAAVKITFREDLLVFTDPDNLEKHRIGNSETRSEQLSFHVAGILIVAVSQISYSPRAVVVVWSFASQMLPQLFAPLRRILHLHHSFGVLFDDALYRLQLRLENRLLAISLTLQFTVEFIGFAFGPASWPR
jgi:hypothetical protein